MSSQNTRPSYLLVALPVVLVIVAAFALSTEAVIENLHFLRATSQIFDLVSMVRTTAAEQKTLNFNAGEDIWDDLVRAGQIPSTTSRVNDWNGQIRAVSLSNDAMRVESDLPVHDCRRMALDFLARQPVELGLISVEAQSAGGVAGDKDWKLIYPQPVVPQEDVTVPACGTAKNARLALVFKIR